MAYREKVSIPGILVLCVIWFMAGFSTGHLVFRR